MRRVVLVTALVAGLVSAGRVIYHAMQAGGALSSVDQNQERLAHEQSSAGDELSTTSKAARGYQGQLARIAQQLQEIAHDLRD